MVVVKNRCGLLDLGTLKSAVSQEPIDEMMKFLHADTSEGKLEVTLIIIS